MSPDFPSWKSDFRGRFSRNVQLGAQKFQLLTMSSIQDYHASLIEMARLFGYSDDCSFRERWREFIGSGRSFCVGKTETWQVESNSRKIRSGKVLGFVALKFGFIMSLAWHSNVAQVSVFCLNRC